MEPVDSKEIFTRLTVSVAFPTPIRMTMPFVRLGPYTFEYLEEIPFDLGAMSFAVHNGFTTSKPLGVSVINLSCTNQRAHV